MLRVASLYLRTYVHASMLHVAWTEFMKIISRLCNSWLFTLLNNCLTIEVKKKKKKKTEKCIFKTNACKYVHLLFTQTFSNELHRINLLCHWSHQRAYHDACFALVVCREFLIFHCNIYLKTIKATLPLKPSFKAANSLARKRVSRVNFVKPKPAAGHSFNSRVARLAQSNFN